MKIKATYVGCSKYRMTKIKSNDEKITSQEKRVHINVY